MSSERFKMTQEWERVAIKKAIRKKENKLILFTNIDAKIPNKILEKWIPEVY